MKKELSTIEIKFIVKELNNELKRSRLDRIYQIDKKEFILQLHQKNKGKIILRVSQKFVWLTKEKPNLPESVSGFCLLLRKYLEGMIIDNILQNNSERIIELLFSNKQKELKLIIELFSLGNIILIDKDNKIIGALDQIELKDRTIKTGELYKYPTTINIFDFKYKKFRELIKIEENISKTLATKLSLGGIYAEELCITSNIDKQATKINEKDLKNLYKNFNNLLKKESKPTIYYENNLVKDITPFDLEIYKGLKHEKFNDYNTALDFVLSRKNIEEKKEKVTNKYKQRLEKIKTIIIAQQKNLKAQEKTTEEEKKKAEHIYENYQYFKDILEQLKKAREKYSWKEIKDKLKGHNFIKDINEKNNEVIVEQ